MIRSLRARLVVGAFAAITVFLAASGYVIYDRLRVQLESEMDRSLESLAQTLAATVNLELAKRASPGRRTERQGFPLPRSVERVNALYQCWFEDGDLFAKSTRLRDESLPRIAGDIDELSFRTIELPDGSSARAVGLRFAPGPDPVEIERMRKNRHLRDQRDGPRGGPGGPPPGRRPGRGGDLGPNRQPRDSSPDDPDKPSDDRPGGRGEETSMQSDAPEDAVAQRPRNRRPGPGQGPGPRGPRPMPLELVVARETTELAGTLGHLKWMLVLAWAVSSIGCAGILWLVVSLGVSPLQRLRDQIRVVDEASLDQHFLVRNAPSELTPVVEQLNAFLDRIRNAFDREQAFASHAAHELRTPIAGLRATLEVALSREREPEEYREAASECLAITTQMQTMVETLLDLARLQSAGANSGRQPVRLDDIVGTSWKLLAGDAEDKGVTLERAYDPEVTLRTDPQLLDRIVDNVLANAVAHGDDDSVIRVKLEKSDRGDATLAVSNALASAPPDIAARAFEAFWRADEARTDVGRHSGLGLALCRRIAPLLGATIDARYADGTFTVRVGEISTE